MNDNNDGFDKREIERVRSQIERDTSDIRTHTFKSQQNTLRAIYMCVCVYIDFAFLYSIK